MEEETLTYDALRRVEREENTSPRLTSLPSRFWQRLGDHLNELRDAFQGQQEEDPTARRTVVLADELRNTQRLAESIWALREKKVVQAALGSVRRRDRDKEASVPSNATKEERDLFVSVIGVLTTARDEAAITDPFSRRKRDRQAKEQEEGQKSGGKETGGVPAHGTGGRSEPTGTGGTDQGSTPAADRAQGPPAVTVASAQDERDHQGQGIEESATGATPKAGAAATGSVPATIPGSGSPGPGQTGEENAEQADEKVHNRGSVGASGEQEMELRLVEALKPVPIFAGPDLVTYELGEGEVGNLPARAAELLERRGVVRLLPAK